MKYVRTKDGRIFDIYQYWSTKAFETEPDENYWVTELLIRNGLIREDCKITDTIEELCDEFFIDYGKERFPYSTYRQHERYAGWGDLIRYLREIHFTGYDGVYGYIWVGNELKPVAKMNEKGELCLI